MAKCFWCNKSCQWTLAYGNYCSQKCISEDELHKEKTEIRRNESTSAFLSELEFYTTDINELSQYRKTHEYVDNQSNLELQYSKDQDEIRICVYCGDFYLRQDEVRVKINKNANSYLFPLCSRKCGDVAKVHNFHGSIYDTLMKSLKIRFPSEFEKNESAARTLLNIELTAFFIVTLIFVICLIFAN